MRKHFEMSEISVSRYSLPILPSDILSEQQIPIVFNGEQSSSGDSLRLLSLFSGCGGMDLGFEGNFIAATKSVGSCSPFVEKFISDDWVLLRRTRFRTIFANDILPEARTAWLNYMGKHGHDETEYHNVSVVDLVKMHRAGAKVFPDNVDIVTGGFPCQDFSVAGKRAGFNSAKDDKGNKVSFDKPSEENRGKLYYWMKQVIDITRPKMFIAENVKGLVSLGNVKDIIQKDFASADGNGYIVFTPKILQAANYGVPESRERVIFIGVRRNALNKDVIRYLEMDNVPPEYNPYPKPTHSFSVEGAGLLSPVCVRDVFCQLSEPENSVDYSQQLYSKAKFLASGGQGQSEIKLDCVAPTIRSEHHGNIEFRRLSKEHGGRNTEELAQGMAERRLTPRECALIQTFPPDYPFVVKKAHERKYILSASAAYKVIGNAVPPILAYNIAKRLEELWPIYFEGNGKHNSNP